MNANSGNLPPLGHISNHHRVLVGSNTVNNFNRMDSSSDDHSVEDRIRSMSFCNLDESTTTGDVLANNSNNHSNNHGSSSHATSNTPHPHYGMSKLKSNLKKGFEKLFSHSTSTTTPAPAPPSVNGNCNKKTASNKNLTNSNNSNNNDHSHVHNSNTSINSVSSMTPGDHRGSLGPSTMSGGGRGGLGQLNQLFNHSTSVPEDQYTTPRMTTNQKQNDTAAAAIAAAAAARSRSGSKDNVLSAAEASGLLCIYRPPPAVPRPPFVKDDPHLADLKKRLVLLDPKARLELQRKAYDLLVSEMEKKEIEFALVKSEIHHLNLELLKKNEAIRSVHEIESLRDDIRNLTNEKAHLEQLISKNSGWSCKSCTYINQDESTECVICSTERDDEIFICNHCQTKNSLNKTSCRNCHAYFGADNSQPFLMPCRPPPPPPPRAAAHQRHQRTPSSSSTTNNNNSSYNLLFMINHNDSATSSSDSPAGPGLNGNHHSSLQTPSPTANMASSSSSSSSSANNNTTPLSGFMPSNYQQPTIPFVPPSKKSGSPLNHNHHQNHSSSSPGVLLPSPTSHNAGLMMMNGGTNHTANNMPRASSAAANNVR